jgi:adenylylsulfate kinase|tara:strand:- start:1224 stop:1748 length:525 start_codon:yes stop_codon:yes gene_type:complete
MIIWITGLSGAGKTTLAKALYNDVKKKFPNTLWIDGDIIRKHYQNTKKYDQKSRIEQYKKMINIAKFCYDQKLNVIISVLYFNNFIFKNNKKLFKNYFQIYLKADIKDLIRRDYKKLYSKNINKKRPHLVGVDIKWNEPKKSDLIIENFFNKKINLIKKNILTKISKNYNKFAK